MNQDKIGNFIKNIRKENNLTQKELASRLGVTFQAVSKWENGKNVPDIAIMKQICDEFNINIDEILNGEKKTSKKKNNFIFIILIVIVVCVIYMSILLVIKNNSNNFEFKTISSNCSSFKINGSAAYNKSKTSIYISNIEFCGKEDENIYKKINCILYEKTSNKKIKISSCDEKNNITLENFLKDVRLNVDNASCKNLVSNELSLEIVAEIEYDKNITYDIPIKLNDNCK